MTFNFMEFLILTLSLVIIPLVMGAYRYKWSSLFAYYTFIFIIGMIIQIIPGLKIEGMVSELINFLMSLTGLPYIMILYFLGLVTVSFFWWIGVKIRS